MSSWNPLDSLYPLIENKTLSQVRHLVKSGKEATVYCCEAGTELRSAEPGTLIAVKIYRPREHRSFKNDTVYRGARLAGNSREERAARNKTNFGREVLFGEWSGHESATLATLHEAGIPVPKPLGSAESVILMEYLGDENQAAPQLISVELEPRTAHRLYPHLMSVIEHMLNVRHVHGDLSAYNILYWKRRAWVIDVPQTVHPWENANAYELLLRDVVNVTRYFAEQGVRVEPPDRVARGMWNRYRYERATY